MNLLLITFSFPPAGGVGVLRALSFARYLPQQGIRVDVLTARNAPSVGKDPSLLDDVPEAVTVHRCWTLDLPFALRKAIKRLLSGKGAGSPSASKPASGGGNPLKRVIANLLLPDPQVGWLPFAVPAARRIIRTRKIDAVLITVPPFSSVLLVAKLRRAFPSLPIVLDFRDEWLSTTINLVSFNSNARAREVAHRVEAEGVRDATMVVAVTEAARREMMNRYPEQDPAKFRYVPNGFETLPAAAMQASPRTGDQVVLTYIGSVYGSTDPGSFVEAVMSLPASLRGRLKIRFIGHIETAAYRASLERLGETVELKGFLPRAEALRALEETDDLLLITHDRINVSAKFYDYLSGTRPILAAVHPEGDVRRLLEETGAGRWANIADPTSIAAMLTEVLQQPAEVTHHPDRERIAGYHRAVLAARYAEMLKELVESKGAGADDEGQKAPA